MSGNSPSLKPIFGDDHIPDGIGQKSLPIFEESFKKATFSIALKGDVKLKNHPAKVWEGAKLKTQRANAASAICHDYNLPGFIARTLAARGFKSDEYLSQFLNPKLGDLPNPDGMLGFNKAINEITNAIRTAQRIAIFPDFDADGLTGGTQLSLFLDLLEVPNKVYVPNRFTDGYGLNQRIMQEALRDGCRLAICVDYGTNNQKEIELLQAQGMQVVVVDHHLAGEQVSSPAEALINPGQSRCGFSGNVISASGLCSYLVMALRSALKEQFPILKDKNILSNFLSLGSIGTIGDLVPLLGPSRVIAALGLKALRVSELIGLRALKNTMTLKGQMQSGHISFGIAPRINAAGRLKDGGLVIELLKCMDSVKAEALAEEIHQLNKQRQEVEEFVKHSALNQLGLLRKIPRVLVAYDQSFHTGVVGIVAQRLVEHLHRPAVVLGSDSSGILKGSVRGGAGFHVKNALENCKDLLLKFGGHKQAGGLSLKSENFELFKSSFERETIKQLGSKFETPNCQVDTIASFSELTQVAVDLQNKLEPFGMGNPSPVLGCRDVYIKKSRVFKDSHLKITFEQDGVECEGMLWREKSHPKIKPGAKVDLVGTAGVSFYSGKVELTIRTAVKAGSLK